MKPLVTGGFDRAGFRRPAPPHDTAASRDREQSEQAQKS
jgi:hypothetical protein